MRINRNIFARILLVLAFATAAGWSSGCALFESGEEEGRRDVCNDVRNRTINAEQADCEASGGEWLAGEASANCYCPG